MDHILDNPGLPAWFRHALIALVTLTLCSCQAPLAMVDPSSSVEEPIPDLRVQQREASSIRVVSNEEPTNEKTPLAGPPRGPSADEETSSTRPATHSEASVPPAAEVAVAPSFVEAVAPLPSPSDHAPRVAARPTEGCETSGAVCEGSCPVDAPCAEFGGCDAGCNAGCVTPYNGPGPKDEYLCDGGDCGPPVGVRPDWTIDGLGQEDTIAHYDTLDGRVLVEPSNKVCIYAPRFGAVRRVVNASASTQRELINVYEDDMALARADRIDEATTTLQQLPPVTKIGERPPSLLRNREQPGAFEARVVVRELKNLVKPYCNLQVVKLGIVDNAEKPWLAKATVAANTWTGDQAAQVTIDTQAASVLKGSVAPGVMYADEQGDPCLRLVKLASAHHAKPGDEIEFTLRFDNVGQQTIGNVTIVDNLTTRLAYVDGTAEASVDADFSTSQNGAGSLVLRWEITQPLKPGEGGVLQFRVKVR